MTDQTAEVEEQIITRPGVYDLTFPEYLADPVVGGSLSSSGARMLLKRTPAHFRHYADHPEDRETSDAFDLGSTVHDLVFGVGKGYVEVKRDNWRTNAAKEEAAAARAEGKTPLLSKDLAKAREMAAAVRAHPLAAALFDPAMGKAEQTIVWRTAPVTGATPDGWATRDPVWCRALIDFLRLPHDDGRPYILPDLKTCESAKPDDVMRSADRYGYHVQGEFYSRAVRSVPGLVAPGQAVRFALVSVEKTKPYLVSVVLPDADAMKVAARRVDDALALYARCRAAGEWPGYGDAAVVGELPPWATRELRDDAW